MKREDGIISSFEKVYNIVSPNSNKEEISLCPSFLKSINVSIMKQIKATLDIDYGVCRFRLSVIAEMHHSSSCGKKI
jgi:hypothetical protein